jgi:hypothetical protein
MLLSQSDKTLSSLLDLLTHQNPQFVSSPLMYPIKKGNLNSTYIALVPTPRISYFTAAEITHHTFHRPHVTSDLALLSTTKQASK